MTRSTPRRLVTIVVAAIIAAISLSIGLPEVSQAAVNKTGFPKYGTVLASVDSVKVYSNGGYTRNEVRGTYGLNYQCMELIQRFFSKWGYPNKWGGHAGDQWTRQLPTSTDGAPIEKIPNNGTATSPPVRGDALVFSGGPSDPQTGEVFGHIALVTGTYNGRVYFVEQNLTPYGQDSLPINSTINSSNKKTYKISTSDAEVYNRTGYTLEGWLHSTKNTPPTTPPSTIVNFEIKLPLIGVGTITNQSGAVAQHPPQSPTTRQVQIRLTDPAGTIVERTGSAKWNPTTGYWTGAVNFGTTLPPGRRYVEIRVAESRYTPYKQPIPHPSDPSKLVPSGIPSPSGWKLKNQYEIQKVRTYLPQPSIDDPNIPRKWVTLISGDINNDKVINTLDYGILLGCYHDTGPPKPECPATHANYVASDIDENGTVNRYDYNLWVRQNGCYQDSTQCYDATGELKDP